MFSRIRSRILGFLYWITPPWREPPYLPPPACIIVNGRVVENPAYEDRLKAGVYRK